MFKRNDDLSIYVTRGDTCAFTVPAVINGVKTQFKNGDVVRFKVTKKKDCDTVVRQKDFLVSTIAADLIEINLSGDDTRIGEVISKPTDYWYEIELNPDTNPQTIQGYDEDGPKILKLFPEGADVNEEDIEVLSKKSLQDLVDYTLEEAKKSGAFTGPAGPAGPKGDPGNTAIDTTFTKKGYAADAQAVGDALNGITASKVGAAAGVQSASGNEIVLANSVDAPFLGLKLFGKTEQLATTGKQLLNNGVIGTSKTGSGITFKANADGSITVHGTATAESYWIIDEKNPINYQGESLIATVGGAVDGLGMVIGYHRADGTVVNSIAQLSKVPDTFAYPAEAATTRIFIYVSAGRTMNNVTIYPMIRYASVADDTYEPYTGLKPSPSPDYPQALETAGNSGNIGLRIGGKNLLSDNWEEWFISGNYLVFDMNSANRMVTLSLTDRGNDADISGVWFGITDSLENPSDIYFWAVSSGKINSVKNNSKYRYAFMYPYTKEIFDKLFARFKLQVELGEGATEYEPYKGSQTLIASAPNGLPGIPVSSGGNYTDENGQRWICDEKDYARGVYVQRVNKKIVSEADITYANNSYVQYGTYVMVTLGDAMENPAEVVAISDKLYGISANYRTGSGFDDKYRCYVQSGVAYLRFPAGTGEKTLDECRAAFTGTTIQYALATPVETPLPAEEMAQYSALHINKPNTSVYNDSSADMEIRYCIPNTAVPIDMGSGKSGEILTVDERGHVTTAPRQGLLTAEEVGARPDNWMPSASDVGAAPAGYGLGETERSSTIRVRTIAEVDALVHNGWYQFDGDTDTINGFSHCSIEVITSRWGVTQIQYVNHKTYGLIVLHRSRYNTTTWDAPESAWEWENPPMIFGEEYRTTERWNGSPVYRKIVSHTNSVTWAGNNTYPVAHGVSNLDLNNVEIVLKTAGYCMPYLGADGTTAVAFFDATHITVRTTGSVSWGSRSWYFEMKYTKTV